MRPHVTGNLSLHFNARFRYYYYDYRYVLTMNKKLLREIQESKLTF